MIEVLLAEGVDVEGQLEVVGQLIPHDGADGYRQWLFVKTVVALFYHRDHRGDPVLPLLLRWLLREPGYRHWRICLQATHLSASYPEAHATTITRLLSPRLYHHLRRHRVRAVRRGSVVVGGRQPQPLTLPPHFDQKTFLVPTAVVVVRGANFYPVYLPCYDYELARWKVSLERERGEAGGGREGSYR